MARGRKRERHIDENGCIECSCCKERKPLEEFYDDKSKPLGKQSYCKNCNHEKKRERAKGKETISEVSDPFIFEGWAGGYDKKAISLDWHYHEYQINDKRWLGALRELENRGFGISSDYLVRKDFSVGSKQEGEE